jgi:hypothetical protein
MVSSMVTISCMKTM